MNQQFDLNFKDLHGDRIDLFSLKKVVDEAIEDIHEWSTNPSFFEFLEFPPAKNIDETKKQVNSMLERITSGEHYWCIKLKNLDKYIGTFRIANIDVSRKICLIGYGLNPKFQGMGYVSEASILVLDFLFNELGMHKVTGEAFPNNVKSLKAAKKLGFKKEGVLRSHYLDCQGKRHDKVVLGLLKDEYNKFKH